ncbi:MAG: AraC family transcriptional regulator [Roseburia sp.]|nr:AraC family transcriptional regulator [Roseburia sp.]MCM1279354.1 AraC family transcriptional regulator [Robinsoniella sp.]
MKKAFHTASSKAIVSENQKEQKEHGDLEYPVGAYLVDLNDPDAGSGPFHWHDEMEICFMKKGCARFMIEEQVLVLSEGQAVFINHNILHAVHPEDDEICIYASIVFHPIFLFGHGQTKLAATYLNPISSNPDLHYILLDGTETFHRDAIAQLQEAFAQNFQKPFGYEIHTRSALSSFWLLLLEHLKPSVASFSSGSSQLTLDEARTKKAILFIQKHYSDTISLDDIASSIHVSKGECCRCFKRSIQLTPFEYLMKYRIFIAAGMIRENKNTSIAALASSVGFNSSSYFNKLFKKYLGCTPTEYRVNLTKKD